MNYISGFTAYEKDCEIYTGMTKLRELKQETQEQRILEYMKACREMYMYAMEMRANIDKFENVTVKEINSALDEIYNPNGKIAREIKEHFDMLAK